VLGVLAAVDGKKKVSWGALLFAVLFAGVDADLNKLFAV
jgi:hypothetical protein